jgi:hypothetical protein
MQAETPRPVQIKTAPPAREQFREPSPVDADPVVDFPDRRRVRVQWFSRKENRQCEFSGEIRVLGTLEIMRASAAFLRVTGGLTYETIPSEARNRIWPQAKLSVMLEGQPGYEKLVDACDHDRYLLAAVMSEVDQLESDCFRNILGAGEGTAGQPRVVVTTSRSTAPASPSVPPR